MLKAKLPFHSVIFSCSLSQKLFVAGFLYLFLQMFHNARILCIFSYKIPFSWYYIQHVNTRKYKSIKTHNSVLNTRLLLVYCFGFVNVFHFVRLLLLLLLFPFHSSLILYLCYCSPSKIHRLANSIVFQCKMKEHNLRHFVFSSSSTKKFSLFECIVTMETVCNIFDSQSFKNKWPN